MIKTILLLTALSCVSATLSNDRASFMKWASAQGKAYTAMDMRARFAIWSKNVDFINNWNAKNSSTVVGMNQFGDLTREEFAKYYLGLKPVQKKTGQVAVAAKKNVQLPASVDWNAAGAVTPVKNQGQCGSCWSFSTTGSVEGCKFIATGNLVSLSEQNLIDCSTANSGCNGGLMDQAFQYIQQNGGIDTESSYPYTASQGSCNYNAANSAATVGGYTDVTSGDEGALQSAVYGAPTSVAIDASQQSFQFYTSGVYSDPACSSSSLDHGVLATGYGTDSGSGSDYWIVKNSWGSSWGQAGFIWMARNQNNMCGIATAASFPTGCQ